MCGIVGTENRENYIRKLTIIVVENSVNTMYGIQRLCKPHIPFKESRPKQLFYLFNKYSVL